MAMDDFNHAIRHDPLYADAYISRGIGNITEGNYEQTCADFEKACKLGDCSYVKWARENGDWG